MRAPRLGMRAPRLGMHAAAKSSNRNLSMDNCMDPGFQESLLSAFWFVNSALPVKFECVRSKISQFCCAVPLLHTSCVPGTSAPLMFACVFLCGLRPPRLHGESPRTTGPVVVRLAERANERERERGLRPPCLRRHAVSRLLARGLLVARRWRWWCVSPRVCQKLAESRCHSRALL